MVGSPPPSLILDASTLINLYATDRLREIALAVPYPFVVSRYVAEREALYVRTREPDGGLSRERIDLTPFIGSGLLRVDFVHGPEQAKTLVDLSRELDQGEARTVAIAYDRGFMVASDDRKARRVAQEWFGLRVLSTTELLRIWADTDGVSTQVLRDTFSSMRTGASFIPGPHDPAFEWWRNVVSPQ